MNDTIKAAVTGASFGVAVGVVTIASILAAAKFLQSRANKAYAEPRNHRAMVRAQQNHPAGKGVAQNTRAPKLSQEAVDSIAEVWARNIDLEWTAVSPVWTAAEYRRPL